MMEWSTKHLKMQLRGNLSTRLCNIMMGNCDAIVIVW